MTRSYVRADAGSQTLQDLPPSSADEIRRMSKLAGLSLSAEIMDELCKSYPAFEAMVRRLPRARNRFDEPGHQAVDIARIAALEQKAR